MNNFALIALAALGSSALTAGVTGWFQRGKTDAETKLSGAQATDIYTQAGERSLNMMQRALEAAQERINQLEERVRELEEALARALKRLGDKGE